MSDVVFVLLGVVLFGLFALYVLGCERLQDAEADAAPDALEDGADSDAEPARHAAHETSTRAGR